jgi:hypothetical protein
MLKKTITYTDYNGLERKEDFYFNLTKAELMKMEMGTAGGLAEAMQKLVNEKEAPAIIKMFEDLVLGAYGEKSPDGKRFIKNDEVRENFASTEAYSILFMELATDADKAADFIKAIIPSDLADEVAKKQPTLLAPNN